MIASMGRVLGVAVAVAVSPAWPGWPQEEPVVPQSGSVPPRALLEYWNAHPRGALYGDREQESAVQEAAVLRVLESLEHTQEFLGTPVVDAVRETLRAEILEDLHVACWVDLYCVAGEQELIAFCVQRAQRFKEAALPVLWELSRESPSWTVLQRDPRRFGEYVERLIRSTLDGSPDPRGLAAALRAHSLDELADRLQE